MITYEVALDQLEIFTLILMRIASFIFAAPFFNTSQTPAKVKIGISFFITVLVYTVNPDMGVTYNGIFDYTLLVIKEVVVGLFLGATTAFCVQIILFAGKIIDMDIGLSMAQIYDPTTKIQVGIMGNFYYYILMLLLMATGLHRYLIQAIIETFKVIPLGGVKFGASIYKDVLGFVSDYFVIGFRIALPIFAAMLILDCILAILARIAPQMNMFVVGMQLKIFVGIFVIFITIVMMPAVSNFIADEVKSIMASLVRGMS